ncbi:hypothetical protein, variant 1 [Aphanomyces astaci]|uniref:BED-type domain-containing protein n=1 Tax=Aphanomyces astaci TaxID=112090 RepID=W4H1Z9_APHAT|nr:hypothetical protein, variant 1 [Aphanomyces astaci]ETV85932.1 hypothetical protein, variant 1 [Aphanomyces astaci]|eukprot:XP_009824411.1 hypothetical protein, variant 1 [Aphanomyces astaci]
MYNHIVDRCPRVEEALREAYRSRPRKTDSAVGITSDMDEEGKDPCVYGSADVGGRHGGGKSKGGRPKDPIWDEFTTTDELRKRRYCMCVWCEKEVKGDTTRMTTHLVERCTEVDASAKAKYTVKHRKLDDDTSVDHVLVALAPSTNVTMTSPQPNASREPISPVVGMTREVVSPSREAASAVDVAALGPFPPPSPPLPHPSYPAPRPLEPPGRPDTMQQQQHAAMLSELGLQDINPGVFGGGTWFGHGPMITVINPSTNQAIASVRSGTAKEYMHVVQSMDKAAPSWRQATAAHRSRVVRHIGDVFRSHHQRLANVLALESGIVQRDAMTLVANMIRRCDDAAAAVIVHSVTASTIAAVHDCAESRPLNTMQIVQLERFGPLGGHVGLLTPAHSPTWTGAMALACGNAVLWKPSLSLIAIAITRLIASVLRSHGYPPACASLICGSGADVGACLARDKRMAVVCYQGSVEHGHPVGVAVAGRLGTSILELDAHNAMVVLADANVDVALRMVLLAMGRRVLRHVYVHVDISDRFCRLLTSRYQDLVVVGDPFLAATTCGPLRNLQAVQSFSNAVNAAMSYGQILCGGNNHTMDRSGNFVAPAAVLVDDILPYVQVHEERS